MPIELSREEFHTLPRKQKDLVIFDNLQAIRKSVHSSENCPLRTDVKNIKVAGSAWLVLLTIALGLKRYLPF